MDTQDDIPGRVEVSIGPVGPIPIVPPVDAKTAAERRSDAAVADALHSPEDLQAGMRHLRPGVRSRVVDRLVARGIHHPGTVPTLLDTLRNDPDTEPRFMAAMVLHRFSSDERVIPASTRAMNEDPDPDVRAEAMSSLDQLGALG